MHPLGGVAAILAGCGVALAACLAWRRVGRAALGLLAIAGATAGAGALLVQSRAGAGDFAITMGALAVLAPLHARVLLGPPSRHGRP
ncbi:MAG TPA: hypothetical protein VFC04_08015 [Actinomycetota bacterium]|nr:hypothetical protein [Actinomycetota bacterium]